MGRYKSMDDEKELLLRQIEKERLKELEEMTNVMYDRLIGQDKLEEKVISNSYKKVYDKNDINRWLKYGLKKKLINMNDKKEVFEWIKLLKYLNFEI
jgi:hypothetical protein